MVAVAVADNATLNDDADYVVVGDCMAVVDDKRGVGC